MIATVLLTLAAIGAEPPAIMTTPPTLQRSAGPWPGLGACPSVMTTASTWLDELGARDLGMPDLINLTHWSSESSVALSVTCLGIHEH